ncbi:MAG: S41 family peptidase [Cytophagales bacterium]
MKTKKFRNIVVVSLITLSGLGLLSFKSSLTDRYFDIAKNLDIFASLFKELNYYYVDEINPNKLIKTGIDEMLESLDPYTNYIPEDDIEDYRTQTTGQYGGIGAVIGKRKDYAMILMPYEGYPAHNAGLKIGDELYKIDDIDLKGKNTTEVSKLLKGQAGTKLKLKVKRNGNATLLDFEITRQRIKIDNIPYYGMVTDEVGYLQLTDFTSNASKEVKEAINKLKEKGMKYLIFDLRDNPGGLLMEAINITNLFIPKDKEIVSTKGKVQEWNKVYMSLNQPLDVEIPIAVLVSSKSASASEIVSGSIQDYDRGVLIGQKTFGKGLVQATRQLSHNSQLKVTTAKYYIPSGRCIQAIDYTNRNEDGSVGKIADSLKKEFKTKNGRTVYDGGGVEPDIIVERSETPAILTSILQKNLIFDYATKFYYENPKIESARAFKISDKEYSKFVEWLKDKDYDYITKVEKTLEDLSTISKKEKYYDDIKVQLDNLKSKVSHNKENDLIKFKSEISESLRKEIVSRYYLQKGSIEASFDSDAEVKEAVNLFKDMQKFNSLLAKKK